MSRARKFRCPSVSVLFALCAPWCGLAQPADVTEAVRGMIEPALREQAGIGFEEFSCEVEPPLQPGQRFSCSALDEEGDRLRYTLAIDEEGTATVVLASQAADSLEPEDLEALSAPCLAFLAAFEARDWERLFALLSPALRSELEPEPVRDRLETVREVLGRMSDPVAAWYSVTGNGSHRLEFRLPAAVGGGVARFGLAREENGGWVLRAFLVHAEPGSPASTELMARLGRTVLGGILETPVPRIEAPFERLISRGDLVEGSIWLEDGRELPVAVQQTTELEGFEAPNYFFSVLDAALVVTIGVEGRLEGVTGVECEAPRVPDGGEIGCVVRRGGEPPVELLLSRRGAEHRLRAAPEG